MERSPGPRGPGDSCSSAPPTREPGPRAGTPAAPSPHGRLGEPGLWSRLPAPARTTGAPGLLWEKKKTKCPSDAGGVGRRTGLAKPRPDGPPLARHRRRETKGWWWSDTDCGCRSDADYGWCSDTANRALRSSFCRCAGTDKSLDLGLTFNGSQRWSCSATHETPTQNQVVYESFSTGLFHKLAVRVREWGRRSFGRPRFRSREALLAGAGAPAIRAQSDSRGAAVSLLLGGILT